MTVTLRALQGAEKDDDKESDLSTYERARLENRRRKRKEVRGKGQKQ